MTLEKGLKFKNRTEVDYSYVYTYLPLHEIKNIEIDQSQMAKEINCLKVYTSNHCLNYSFHHKNSQIISLYDSLCNINNYSCT
ncbi:hypothetical protein [Anaeromicrobium sediminis]|uniref:hypothetical protein n=1 Tax=Anaeromicrobium sediminis TaxID=1478221 RepID=UPI001140259D|nr:hypothetical protein [Anaeromicrobium sediminis]